ncbi:receptor [Shigella sonnei]|uniref:ISAs1 family transposase n=1 Tax=Shigella sonnei TaxID=624 RepID=UPI000663AB05|nr:ISAs1 family transposase [Shigella sonnei]CSS44350.1 receptor [Shigella sonnei]
MELKKLMEHISIIPDYRQAWKVEHKLSDILLLTICAVISGAEGWEDIEDFGETHLDFLKQYGDFENGIPVHDTIARVVSCISPAKFHECFINWMRDCHSSDDKDVIAIDGKTLRHSYDKSRRRGAIHVISAFSTMHSLVIGQIKTDEKSLHWRLDVVMNEDDCKIRRGNAAELFSGIRHIAINVLTNDKVFKAGLRRKMRKAAMDRNYLASVLAGSGLS